MTYDDIAHRIEVAANKLFDDGNAGMARVLWGIEDDLVALSSRPPTPENVECPTCRGHGGYNNNPSGWYWIDCHRCRGTGSTTTRERGGTDMKPAELKVAICECLIDINNEVDPVTRERWPPIIAPTSIDWIGDRLVVAVLAILTPENVDGPT